MKNPGCRSSCLWTIAELFLEEVEEAIDAQEFYLTCTSHIAKKKKLVTDFIDPERFRQCQSRRHVHF